MVPERDTIRNMRLDECAVVGKLHREQLDQAFLSTLGIGFLTQLYRGIAASEHGIVLVATDETDRIVGFVSGSTNTKQLYRSVLLRRGWIMALLLLPQVVRPSVIKRVWQSLRYPTTHQDTLPEAELLSIAVSADMQGRGPGGALLHALLAEWRRQGIRELRVTVGAQLARANAYYVKHGFVGAGTIVSHGKTANVYVRSTDA